MSVPPYDEAGSGSAIVLSHGTMMDRSMFGPQLAALSRWFRVIAFDHRARTARWEGPYSLNDLTGDCLDLLDALGIEKCVLGGMSMGGFMALRLALQTSPAVVMCDLRMPGIDGHTLMRRAKAQGITRCPIRDIEEKVGKCPVDFRGATPEEAKKAVEQLLP